MLGEDKEGNVFGVLNLAFDLATLLSELKCHLFELFKLFGLMVDL